MRRAAVTLRGLRQHEVGGRDRGHLDLDVELDGKALQAGNVFTPIVDHLAGLWIDGRRGGLVVVGARGPGRGGRH